MAEGSAAVQVQRARIEEIRELADEYRRDEAVRSVDGPPPESPIPPGGVFWIATDGADGRPLGYAAGTLRAEGLTVGPIYVRPQARRRGVGLELLRGIQRWAEDTRIPVVEISVAIDNLDGRAFLEASGYVPRRILFSLTPRGGGAAAGVPTP